MILRDFTPCKQNTIPMRIIRHLMQGTPYRLGHDTSNLSHVTWCSYKTGNKSQGAIQGGGWSDQRQKIEDLVFWSFLDFNVNFKAFF